MPSSVKFSSRSWLPVLVATLTICSCEEGYQRGDCDPGWLDVDGTCTLAVGQDCEGNGDCLSGICYTFGDTDNFCTIRCGFHDDCPTGFFCDDQTTYLCHPGKRPPACQSAQECEPCQECVDGFCLDISGCVRCLFLDEDCGPCQRCEQKICVDVANCVRCLEDLNCPACEECNPEGECQSKIGCIRCESVEDCPGCMACVLGACELIPGCGTDPCFNDADCPQGTRCLPDSVLGYSTCLSIDLPFGADCSRGGDATCAEGVCVTSSGGQTTCSRECESASDCPATLECLPDDACLFACREDETRPPGDDCRKDADCPSTRVCGLLPNAGGTAWRPRCVEPLVCAGQPGEPCDREQQDRCTSGICTLQGFCSPVCAADFDCPEDFLCDELLLPLPSGELAPFFGCAPRDQVLGAVGEPCPQGDLDCRSRLCLEEPQGGAHPYCSQECIPGNAECPDRFECRQSPLDPGSDLCQPSLVGGVCSSDLDCPDPQVCTLDPGGLTVCIDPLPDGVDPGEPCGEESLCKNALCLRSGYCGAMCSDPADCPAGFICDYVEIYLSGGARAYARICTPDPGSMLACQHNADCPAGESCGLILNPWGTGFDGQCAPDGPGGDIGQTCTVPQDCRGGFCPTNGKCTVLCVDDADCPADYACLVAWVELWEGASFPIDACIWVVTGDLGDPCPGGATDCVSGICYHPQEGEPYCTKECTGDEDCSDAAGFVCFDDGSAVLYCLQAP